MYRYIRVTFLATFLLSLAAPAWAQSSKNKTIDVFLDCRGCSETYIRDHISFVNYVRNKENASVHLLATRRHTGSGGTEYTLKFIGRKQFKGKNDTLRYISPKSDTREERQQGLVKHVKLGLLPYINDKPVAEDLTINYKAQKQAQATPKEDRWNHWVFEVSLDTYLSGQETRKHLFLSGGVSAERVTHDWKINLNYERNYNRRSYTQDDTTNTYITRSQFFNGTVVKSLTDHWSAGIFTEANHSSRNNIDLSYSASPAIEYNIFPYAEYSEHEISFMYTLSAAHYNYSQPTIFNKTEETLFRQRLRANIDINQPWGEFRSRISASAFMHDLNKNKLEIHMNLNFRIFRGLSLDLSGRYSWIHDQLSIPKGEITDAEQLLNLREQATSYSYGASIGIRYSFGSIYNNIVNPRF